MLKSTAEKHYLYEIRKLLPYVIHYNPVSKEGYFENRDYEVINRRREIDAGGFISQYLYKDSSQPIGSPELFLRLIRKYKHLGITKLLSPNDYLIRVLQDYS